MYQRILVATDGSPLSEKAVSSAIALAALCKAKLIAIKVVPYYPQSYFEGSVPLPAEDVALVEEQWTADAQASVNAVQAEADALGVEVLPLVVKSDLVSEAVIASAQEHGADLIVMASHGRKGLQRLLLGSETQNVLTHSHIPVLVLR
jgi:nucleotide-binding universal stress UspA family protein